MEGSTANAQEPGERKKATGSSSDLQALFFRSSVVGSLFVTIDIKLIRRNLRRQSSLLLLCCRCVVPSGVNRNII
ncbi:unnamed protein product [Ilex paraguariensis]|uniref:Uncharacterized protein n=1 Tax=Ilex paraguariensis TaxID=185542 RepID=A0ABC8R1L8_9AQUA